MFSRSHVAILILSIGLVTSISSCKKPEDTKWELQSPDGLIQIVASLEENAGKKAILTYEVYILKEGIKTTVIEKSPLGLNRKDQQFGEGLSFVSKTDTRIIDERYEMKIGRQSVIRNNANEIELHFKSQNGAALNLLLRAYNDGVAFKYIFPGTSDSVLTVTNELTGFKLPKNGKAWIEPYDVPSKWTPAYEKFYEDGIPVGTPSPNAEGWAFPALFHSGENWLLIAEANLGASYCGARFEQTATDGLYKIRFPEEKDAEGTGNVQPSSTLPWSMPWRTIIIGNSPGTILESQMIFNLGDTAIPGDFSWVKPGRSSWSWLSDNESPKNFASLKSFVDLAAEMNWEYSLVDANWEQMKGGDIVELVEYANAKNVGILMWYNSGGPHNIVTEGPRDIMYDAQRRKEEFRKLRQWGVKGVKIDFWHSDKQNLITLYHDVLKDAAENQIMVNFHGCTIPRGWSRTYPNLVSMEAVKGEEAYLFDSTYPSAAPIQNSILPFTRNAIGPMDYTPFALTNFKYPHTTSYAHELALTLIFNSGILHFADNVKTYRSLPGYVKEFIMKVPVVFDETHFISGEPGKSIILASRKGKDWWIAGINSGLDKKEFEFTMPFITKGQYALNIITDGSDARMFANGEKKFMAGDTLKMTMPGNGGFVARLIESGR